MAERGCTPLALAATHERNEMVTLLVAHGADVNKEFAPRASCGGSNAADPRTNGTAMVKLQALKLSFQMRKKLKLNDTIVDPSK